MSPISILKFALKILFGWVRDILVILLRPSRIFTRADTASSDLSGIGLHLHQFPVMPSVFSWKIGMLSIAGLKYPLLISGGAVAFVRATHASPLQQHCPHKPTRRGDTTRDNMAYRSPLEMKRSVATISRVSQRRLSRRCRDRETSRRSHRDDASRVSAGRLPWRCGK